MGTYGLNPQAEGLAIAVSASWLHEICSADPRSKGLDGLMCADEEWHDMICTWSGDHDT